MDESFVLHIEGKENEGSRRLSLPGPKSKSNTPLRLSDPSDSQRSPRSSVLKDLINILPRHRNRVVPYSIKSGGGSGFSPNACASSPNPVTTVVTTPSAPANTVCKSDEQEANVEFARELVVKVVENIPAERKPLTPEARKDIDFVDKLDKEDCSSVASLERSESSFFSLLGTDHNTSLPDLLQPEAVYKKHADTDTDTAEYESAAETDLDSPLNAILNGSQSFLSDLIEFETPEETKIIDEGVKNESSSPDYIRSENTVVHSSVTSELKNSDSQQTDDTVCVSAELNSYDKLTAYPLSEENDISEEIEKRDNTCFETNNLNEVSPCAVDDQVVNNDSSVVCEISINSVDETVVNVTHTNLITAVSQESESVSSESKVTEASETFDTTEKFSQLQEPREYVPELQKTSSECPVSPTVISDFIKPVSDLCDSSTEVETSIPVDIKNSDKDSIEILSDNSLLKESIVESIESVIKTTVCSEKFTAVDVPSTEIVTIPPEFTSDVTECPEILDTDITINIVTPTEIGKSKTEAYVAEKSEEITETVFVPETELCIEALIPKASKTVEQIPELKRVFSIESDKKNDSLSDLVSNLQNLHLNDSSIVSVKHIDQHSTAEQSEEDIVTSTEPTDVLSTLSEGVTAASNHIEETNDSLSDIVSKVNSLKLTDSICDGLSQKNETVNSDVPLNADSTNVTSCVVEPGFLKSATQFNSERVLNSETPQLVETTVTDSQLPEPTATLLKELTVVVKDNSSGSSDEPNYLHDTFISQPKSFDVEISPQETALSENVETNLISEHSQVPINVNLCNSSGHSLQEREQERNISLVSVDNFNNCEVKEPGILDSTCSVLSPNVQSFSINFDNVERKKKNFGAEDISPVPLTNGVVAVNNTELKLNINTSTPIPKDKQKPGLDELYEICNRQQRLLEQEDNCFLKEGPGPSIFNISGNLADLETLDAENFQDNNLSLEEIVEIEAKRLSEVFHAGSRECDSSDDENNSLSVNAPIAMESPKTLNNLNSVVSQSPGHSPPNALKSGVTRGSSPAKRGSPPLSVAADSTNFSPKLKSTPTSTKLQNDSNTTRNLNEQLISRKLNRDESPSKETQLNRSASPRSLSPAVQKVSSRDSLRSSPVNVNLQEADTMRKDNDFHSVDSHSNNIVSQSSPSGLTNCDMTQPNAELVNRTIQELADHNSSARKELSYCSPTKNPALLIVEKLINSNKKTPVKIDQHLSGNASRLNFNESNEEDENLKELLMVRELLNRQSEEYQILLEERDKEVDALLDRLREKDERISLLNKRVNEKTEAHKQMSLILEEYEKTISRLVADKEQEQRAHEIQIEALRKEKDADKGHLEAIEIAFSDLHKKYERSKEVIEGLRKNEEVLRSSLSEYESIIRSEEQKYTTLKQHASAQLEKANVELDQMRRNQQAEISKLKAMLKKAEVNTSSLEEILKQKTKENQELTAICDELINKVGSSD